ncbi:ketopantoate reductase family protein [Paenibacillus endoradicis]|uniref:ketopantoate reductase family protein n=1 Tax=Paenibacillus endoradicis TaxID=2972487 RepID=UPI002158DC25|nr:2-dehydropantoate 2-reductase [Paenibacillus endoradicis]MCR8655989.1 2-dehydropantoate 2-reductase [Paenibacillus endoradicis]MCR8658315.1 2-dehydropantoate 2-reductase [Paenibacillus endoradicis]
MRFEIIGNGAIGTLYGAKLIQAGYAVHFWTRSIEQAEFLRTEGITLVDRAGKSRTETQGTYRSLKEFALHPLDFSSTDEIYILLTVKQTQLDNELLAQIKLLLQQYENCTLVAFQNGIGHIERLAELSNKPIITAVISEAALKVQSNEVHHTGAGLTNLGDQLGRDSDKIHQKILEEVLFQAGFKTLVSKNIREAIYRKLIANAVINPLTALFGVKNGKLSSDSTRLQLMKQLFEETRTILAFDELEISNVSFDQVLHICEATSSNTSSMLSDVLAHRVTEILAINGAIVKIASKHGYEAGLNMAIVQLILALHPEK